jgi:hypothetical protein
MQLQNRVTPFGEIVADPARGMFMGNRGILHDAQKRLGKARWKHPHWVICRIEFKDRQQEVMRPGAYTQLFFLDEAVALAAGHRPCATCRRVALRAFIGAWGRAVDHLGGGTGLHVGEIDRQLHRQRVCPRSRRQIRHMMPLDNVPDGAFVTFRDEANTAYLVLGDGLLPWKPGGYGLACPKRPGLEVGVLTPPLTLAALRAGYRPVLHPSAGWRAMGTDVET